MSGSLIKWLIISALVHFIFIVLSSVLPLLFSLTIDSPTIENVTVDLTEDVAYWDDDSHEEFGELVIDPDSLNIDVVKISRVNDLFKPEVADELGELIRIYKRDKLTQEEINKERSEQELSDAKSGLNVINTYPLGVHANVILENLDFTEEFDAEISFRVNNDGSFRAIETTESSGWEVVDRSLENIFKELSSQRIAFFTNFRRMSILVNSDGEDLVLTVSAYLKDSLKASSIYLLLTSVVNSSKSNNKGDEETMTILNNLRIEQNNNALRLTINAKALFVRDAIRD